MEQELGIGLTAIGLIVGFPLFLLTSFLLLGRLERWMIQPDERAAEVARVLEQADRAEEVEEAVTRLLSDLPASRPGTRPQRPLAAKARSRLPTARARTRRRPPSPGPG